MDKLKPCPFCGKPAKWEKKFLIGGIARCSDYQCIGAFTHLSRSASVREWNTRPTDALKAELEELRYIVKQFEQWRGDDDTGCPKYQHPDYPCPGEKEFKKKFGEDADFDSIECDEWGEGCWVEYYRWKYRQKNNTPDTEKGGEDEVR